MSERKRKKQERKEARKQAKEVVSKRDQRLESERQLAKRLHREEVRARKDAIKNREPFKGLQIIPNVSLFDEEDKEEVGGA